MHHSTAKGPMKPKNHVIGNLLLTSFIGLCCLCTIAIASDLPEASTVKADSVTVYSNADTLSRKVKTLNRSDVFYVQSELITDSARWCVINNSNDVFIGYVLCDAIEPSAKSPAKDERTKRAQKKLIRNKSPLTPAADDASKTDRSYQEPHIVTKIIRNGFDLDKQINTVDRAIDTNMRRDDKLNWLAGICLFLIVGAVVYYTVKHR